ncbi:Lactate dehydrogenase [Tistlia consotensis]|uniref:Lactate dehydrogenase n=1 Tax=Tistlia consotensis USBA 355 TaxID=560819 RepID=A0A1Y6C8W4_9PROT|nr:D-glycerate dehydrogenase [Tistlia consotensis]SMF43321.1 Lactate dehydrogenase [Tistlia consotensis USBA 355]SNR42453.1 Lactate dehydrogenase [Tistlia consotensis]
MTDRPLVLATRRLPPAVTARLQRDYRATLNESDEVHSPDRLVALAEGCDAILCCSSEKFTAGLIGRLPASVRAIATFSVGYEHIDTAAAQARGIRVTNTPDVLTDATADITLLCLLGAARRAWEGEAMLRNGEWVGWSTTQLLGVHVTGKRLGIFGMGRIGRAVARRARGFDMQVHYHNRRRLPAEQEEGATYHADPDELLGLCDFVSLNFPASAETENFLNAERIARLPDGAVVVNTARGTVVDDDALIAALQSGKLAAAGLDVFRGEPKLDPRYRELPNAFLLPHMGSATIETRDAMGLKCLDNLDAFFAGKEPPDALV